ncbi:MAG: methylamine utilization protein MauJ [bacterium]
MEDKSLFIRYSRGNKLPIENNLPEIIQEIVGNVKKQDDLLIYLESKTKKQYDMHIFGVSLESTWYQIIKELHKEVEEHGKTNFDLLGLLIILAETKSLKRGWNKIKKFLLDNIDIFIKKEIRRSAFIAPDDEIIKGKDGKYYVKRDGKIITEIIGIKTELEERFNYLSANAKNRYGQIHLILKFITLYFIHLHFKKFFKNYPKSVICVLPESDDYTHFLYWHWSREEAYNTRYISWRPDDCRCDCDWLADDFISWYCDKENIPSEITPKRREDDHFIDDWEKAFNGYDMQLEIGLDTGIYLGQETDTDIYFDFEGRKIRWINGNNYYAPILMIPTSSSENYEETISIAKKFLSRIAFDLNSPIKEISSVGTTKKARPITLQPKNFMGMRYPDPQFINLLPSLADEQEIALAFYREGMNSYGPFYAFLNFYKIVTLNCGENEKKFSKWVDDKINSKPQDYKEWLKKYVIGKKTPAQILREANRNAIAHTEKLRSGDPTINPDHLPHIQMVRDSEDVIKRLARIALQEIIKKPCLSPESNATDLARSANDAMLDSYDKLQKIK